MVRVRRAMMEYAHVQCVSREEVRMERNMLLHFNFFKRETLLLRTEEIALSSEERLLCPLALFCTKQNKTQRFVCEGLAVLMSTSQYFLHITSLQYSMISI